MDSKAKKIKKKKSSITNKLLISTFLFTVVPLIITGLLIIFAYQSLVENLLAEKGVEIGGEVLGNLFEALNNAKTQAFLTIFIAIILTLFGNILMSRNITRPLGDLVRGVEEVARGNLSFKIKAWSDDELGELSRQFNRMTEQLREAKTALEGTKEILEKKVEERTGELRKLTKNLEEAKAILEIRVQARTQELEGLTENLEAQIKQRTRELREKIEEMEKFQKFAVGRETKMVELKERIKKLERDLGKEKEV